MMRRRRTRIYVALIDGQLPTRVCIFINARLRFKGSGIILAECTLYLRGMVHETIWVHELFAVFYLLHIF